MSTAFVPNRRRRQWVLGALTILLHAVVFSWFGGQVGLRHEAAVRTDAPMTARLVEDAPTPAPVPVAPPQPDMAMPDIPVPEPEPVAVADPVPAPVPPAPAPTAPASDAASAEGNAQAGAEAGAPVNGQAGAAIAQAPAAAPAPAPAAAPAPANPAPVPHRYKVDMPPSADITLDVARVDADGTRWSGEQLLSWRVTPSSYRIQVEAGIGVVFTRINLLTITSEGTVGDDGFVPVLMTEKRRGRAMTATHFNRDAGAGTLTFSASQASYPLVPGTQDKASVPLQLAAIARGDVKQLSGNIDIFVGEDRDASVFSFTVAGQEQIDTPLGKMATWHLVRPPKPGSYNSRLELWLAPGYGWYPVQTRNVESSGAVTTQTVRKIVMKDGSA